MANQTLTGRHGRRASADSEPSSLIFGPLSESNVSHIVQVDTDPFVVRAYNLTEGDVVVVEMVDGDGAGSMFAPFCPFDGQSSLTYTRNVLVIGIPGRYRFVLQRTDGEAVPLGMAFVRAYPAQMSHDYLVAYMRCNGG
ncbi:hypothetical protein [Paraburkholderia antibiotica]|jgi:hypothetical protein|uniref:Uncharacterized protein n=1 Tax=Paraburkholderia antibiotica TaxID=2728839 RepID=A0A7Y0A110_9BURK|nr:hypothetical protein [Paraburkholderia antibiotica]NML34524.1 hypothetical protein [Paraburkholderia antibiotica]